jgi:hypothetical protein
MTATPTITAASSRMGLIDSLAPRHTRCAPLMLLLGLIT